MKFFGLLLVSFLSVSPFFADAQQKQIKFEHLGNKQGLSQSNVLCILQDSRGFMWFGTRDGLNRYDGYKFIVYKNDPANNNSISNNFITDITEDSNGDLWVATRGGGISRFERSSNKFYNYTHNATNNSIADNNVNALARDKDGNIWIGTESAGLDLFNTKLNTFFHFTHSAQNLQSISDNFIRDVYVDSKNQVWAGTAKAGLNLYQPAIGGFKNYQHDQNTPSSLSFNDVYVIYEDYLQRIWIGTNGGGLAFFDQSNNIFTNFKSNTPQAEGLRKNEIYSINEDKEHNLWIGTENGGLSILNTKTGIFTNYQQDDIDNSSLSNNSIYAICRDKKGNMWVGTFTGGVDFYNRDNQFIFYKHSSSPQSLSDNRVLCIYEDAYKNIWVGTDGGGLNHFDPFTSTFTAYKHSDNDNNSLCGNYVLSACEDSLNNLWLGTWGNGISVYDHHKKTFKNLKHDPKDSNSLSSNNAWTIYQDRDKNMWVGTIGGGLNKYNPADNTFEHFNYREGNNTGINNNNVECLYDDGKGQLWIGTAGGGLNIMSKATGEVKHYMHNESRTSIAGNTVVNIHEDSKGYFWIATNAGLSMMNESTGRFTNFTVDQGLPSNLIFGIVEDNNHYLWISTGNGISRMDASNNTFKNYSVNDGLQGNEFKEKAFCKGSNGALYFGGNNGFNAFFPHNIARPSYDPPLIMTGLKIFNNEVTIAINEHDSSPLRQDITETSSIAIPYSSSVIQFEFATLNYSSNEKKQYAYMLEGFDETFTKFSTKRTATYTNLDPGNYILRVKGLNNDGTISTHELIYTLTVIPPFWLTWWFRTAVVLLCTSLIYYIYRYRINAEKATQHILEQLVKDRTQQLQLSTEEERRAREDAEIARKEAEEANKAKSVFLATMSHEIRTPMNGLIGMSTLLAQTELSTRQREYTDVIQICGDTLLNVINDILDFSKIESGNMSIEANDFELRSCIEEVLDMFAEKAAKNGVDLIYSIDYNVPEYIVGDKLRLRQVLMNLVSNSIKFTHAGEVFVHIKMEPAYERDMLLSFTVTDTGIGIPADKLDRLFKAFSQVDSSTTRKYGGTGLGLIICEKLVHLMDGNISVSSESGKGSSFKFTILTKASTQAVKSYLTRGTTISTGKRILIVDDNTTNRTILFEQLTQWNMVPVMAADAYAAIQILEQDAAFDLILTDMEMPGMDGATFALHVQHHFKQTPVILLTSLCHTTANATGNLFAAVITKPIKLHMLSKEIEKALHNYSGIAQATEITINKKEAAPATFLPAERYPLNILLAEDDMFNQMIAVQLLETLGYEITVADNGRIALERMQQQQYDIVFMDVQMPEMDGYQTTHFIRNDLAYQPIILAMTANAMDGDKDKCLAAGMDDYISKPINFEELTNKLEHWAKQVHLRKQIISA